MEAANLYPNYFGDVLAKRKFSSSAETAQRKQPNVSAR